MRREGNAATVSKASTQEYSTMTYGAPIGLTRLQQFIFGRDGRTGQSSPWRRARTLRRAAESLREVLPTVQPEEVDIVFRLRSHVWQRGGPTFNNGAWSMMLEAADEIERLRS
jgi:hypothetical protein